jgi:hypothetical protein
VKQRIYIIYLLLQRAYRLINDIKEYNKIGGLKKQLETLCAQVYAVKQVCSNQYQATVALAKLKSYGVTDDHILNLTTISKEM